MSRKDLLPILLLIAGGLSFAFLGGFVVSHFQLPPQPFLGRALDQGAAWLRGGAADEDDHHLNEARYPGEGVEAPRRAAMAPGVTLVTSLWHDLGGGPAARILDADGEVLATYAIDPSTLFDELPYQDSMAGRFAKPDNYIHGSHLFANGDLLCNVEYLGLVRLRPSGEIVWKLPRRTHHAVWPAADGSFWVCAANVLDDEQEVLERFPGLLLPLVEDVVLNVSPHGEVLREISILELLWQSKYRARISQAASPEAAAGDVLHLNDVEELPAALADAYPGFEAGDLMVSLRDIHTVLVFDPDDGTIRWFEDSVLTRQHDADFLGDGWISVFDNNSDEHLGLVRGGSRIVRLRPHDDAYEQVFPPPGESMRFYTFAGGKAQWLDGGNLLITEAQAGRILEVDPDGRLVWSWLKAREPDGEMIAEVMEGTRYPFTPEEVRAWQAR